LIGTLRTARPYASVVILRLSIPPAEGASMARLLLGAGLFEHGSPTNKLDQNTSRMQGNSSEMARFMFYHG
jgi:hypothetical protein